METPGVTTGSNKPRDTMNDSRAPHPKVAAGGAAGAASIVIVYIANQLGLDVPAEVASAFTVLLGTAAAYVKRAA